MAIFITGGTGFVGKTLINTLAEGDKCLLTCSRNAERAKQRLPAQVAGVIPWNPAEGAIDFSDQPKLDAVVNLMGEPIAEGRWNAAKKARIRDSRVQGTRNLITGLIDSQNLPGVIVSASAVGIYGDAGESMVNELHPVGNNFLADVCVQWESAANRLREYGVRVVNLRIGIVLGRESGALAQLVPIFRWGIGGRLGSGKQWVPWIHLEDLVRMIVWCIDQPSVAGPVNATAPNPERNQDLTRQLAAVLRRPALLPVPKFAARIALGEFADSLFHSQRVVPESALSHGFNFKYPRLGDALENLLKDSDQ